MGGGDAVQVCSEEETTKPLRGRKYPKSVNLGERLAIYTAAATIRSFISRSLGIYIWCRARSQYIVDSERCTTWLIRQA